MCTRAIHKQIKITLLTIKVQLLKCVNHLLSQNKLTDDVAPSSTSTDVQVTSLKLTTVSLAEPLWRSRGGAPNTSPLLEKLVRFIPHGRSTNPRRLACGNRLMISVACGTALGFTLIRLLKFFRRGRSLPGLRR